MRRPKTGRRWTVLGMAFGAVAGAGGAFGQRLWDDPAFVLYREAVEAMDRRDHERAAALARSAIGHYPASCSPISCWARRPGQALERGGGGVSHGRRPVPGLVGRRRALQTASSAASAAETAAVESGA